MLLVRTRLPTANPAVIFKPLADGGVIFAADSEIYFGVNEVGAHLWRLLPPVTTTVDEMVAELTKQYPEVEADTIRKDVLEMLDDLEKYQLVVAPADDGQEPNGQLGSVAPRPATEAQGA